MTDRRRCAAVEDAVNSLLSEHLDALFWRPTRLGVDSAWYGHLPFAHWIVVAARPRLLVELGTHAGVSYAAFCEAVQRARLDTRCVAVDTWRGDEHAGFYGEDVYQDLLAFHDARYAGFSRLVRSDFDGALGHVGDASIDLLHIDGRHTYADVRHDFESWRPKLSDRAVVLFHDTNVRERDFGVWKLWAELCAELPHFEFLHAFGLGVLCVGEHAAAPVRALCALRDAAAVSQLRERFALLGERWVLDAQQHRLRAMIQHDFAAEQEHTRTLEAKFAEMAAYAATLERNIGQPPARAELRVALARAVAADHERRVALDRTAAAETRAAMAEARAASARADAETMRAEMDRIAASRSWRIAQRLRAANELVAGAARHPLGALRHAETPAPAPESPSVEPAAAPAVARRPRVLFAAGEPNTPGCTYRCARNAEAATAAGWDARWKPAAEVDAADLRDTDLVILWRVTWSAHVEGVIEHTRLFGGRVALDLDDLMIRPELAKVEYIDAIRSINWSEAHVRAMFSSVMHVLHAVDFCIATTDELAGEMRRHQKASYVLVNGFDRAALRRSRLAARARAVAPGDGLVRIGYASGSRTHQRDFAAAADALAAVLHARPQARLVLFRSGSAREGLVAPEEFPALATLAERIEWREMVRSGGAARRAGAVRHQHRAVADWQPVRRGQERAEILRGGDCRRADRRLAHRPVRPRHPAWRNRLSRVRGASVGGGAPAAWSTMRRCASGSRATPATTCCGGSGRMAARTRCAASWRSSRAAPTRKTAGFWRAASPSDWRPSGRTRRVWRRRSRPRRCSCATSSPRPP